MHKPINMKHLVLSLLLLIFCNNFLLSQNLTARIKVDIERKIGGIDENLYGNFTEHLGRCIYGGLYEPGSAKADNQGFRTDVLNATKEMGVSLVRWPGGNFASGYHWMDGIGNKANRPKRKDLAWGDTESNQVGTDEFLAWSKAAKVAPYICVNLGTGSLDEARNWVEYCNAPTGLYYSDLRAANGHPEPYNVQYWGLGNEIDGPWQMGHKNAEDYSKFALEAAKLMKWSDDKIKLIASGSSNYGSGWTDWNRTVLNSLGGYVDYISLHNYVGNHDKDHYKFMASTIFAENVIKITEGLIKEATLKNKIDHPIYIAFDEYNVWYRAWNEQKLEEHYNMQDALVIASYLNCFIRNAQIVKMANLAQLVNVIAPMMVTHDTLWYQTTFYPLQLFAENCKGNSIASFVECASYKNNDKDVPYLDVSTVYNDTTKELMINVVNRHLDKGITTSITNQFGNLSNKAMVYEINSPDIMDENTVSEQKVKTKEKSINVSGNSLQYTFPAHSFTMIKIKMN